MSVFRHLAGSVQAKHIQGALGPRVRGDQSGQEASELLLEASMDNGYDPMSRISLVMAGDRPVGWIGLDMLDPTESEVATVAEAVSASAMVSGDTPVLEVVRLFSNNSGHFYFVLQESQITGTIHYADLVGAPFKLCLFALTLELETAALDLALQTPIDSWSALSE